MATPTTLNIADASQLNALRAELKQWEKAFAEANGGKKAGRQDIKQDPDIGISLLSSLWVTLSILTHQTRPHFTAAKYKTYGRLRALEESSSSTQNAGHEIKDVAKTPSKSDQHHARSKRKYATLTAEADGHTPRKARREVSTPAKNRVASGDALHPAVLDPYDSPSVFRRLFSPTTHRQPQTSPLPLKTAIGPTPQRNGKILGLFDMLSASGGSTATPSAKRTATLEQTIVQTPSRSKAQRLGNIAEVDGERNEEEDDDENDVFAMGRTPASSSKKLYLERLFATPTTLRFATMMEADDDRDNEQSQRALLAPTQTENQLDNKIDPLGSETPSFLRRSNSGRYTSSNDFANHDPLSPVGVRKHQRFSNGKGLTALVQGLRDMEKERMEDEWEILNEIEAEQNHPTTQVAEDVQVGDSQVPHNNINGMTTGQEKAWKKKTQKRTTRLVKMKPVIQVKSKPSRTATEGTSKPTKPTRENNDDDDEYDDDQPTTRTLRERKHTKDNTQEDDEEEEENGEYDVDDIDSDNSSDGDFTESAPKQQRATSSFTEKIKAAFSSIPTSTKGKDGNRNKKTNENENDTAKGNGKPSPKKRRVNPDAHANYRSLKIRSKGQGRFRKGRFGRR